MPLRTLLLSELHVDDERSFRHVGLYAELKRVLLEDGYRFRVPAGGAAGPGSSLGSSWDRVLFLNLTFWSPGASDVLVDDHVSADVVAHVAWHHLARRAVGSASADALFLGEAIASAFDLYLVGRLLGHAPDSSFLETQVPAMADAAAAAGLSDDAFEAMLEGISADPEGSFEQLRQLLFDAATTLVRCGDVDEAASALAALDARPLAPLLHHYELSNWVLYAKAYTDRLAPGRDGLAPDPAVRAIDAALRAAPVSLDWLERQWVHQRSEDTESSRAANTGN